MSFVTNFFIVSHYFYKRLGSLILSANIALHSKRSFPYPNRYKSFPTRARKNYLLYLLTPTLHALSAIQSSSGTKKSEEKKEEKKAK